jgi:RNA polymerase-interacting CarD/CdnL/TRCF family regulator
MIRCVIQPSFKHGDHVLFSPHGIGKIVGTEEKGPTALPCYAISFASGLRAFVPIDQATTMLKPLATRSQAEDDLAILRGACAGTEAGNQREIREERAGVLRNGTSMERATVLRRLYASKQPLSDANASAIRAFEDSVLEELSIVLGLERRNLEREMRERYPLSTKKQSRT